MPVVEDGSILNIVEINKAFARAYEQLARQEPINCDKSNVIHDSVPSPTCAIIDVSIWLE